MTNLINDIQHLTNEFRKLNLNDVNEKFASIHVLELFKSFVSPVSEYNSIYTKAELLEKLADIIDRTGRTSKPHLFKLSTMACRLHHNINVEAAGYIIAE